MYLLTYVGLHAKCFLLVFNYNQVFFRQFCYIPSPTTKFHEIHLSRSRGFPCGHTDGQTHKLNETNSELRSLVNAHKNATILSLAYSNFQNIPKKKFNSHYLDGFVLKMSVLDS